MPGGPKKQLGLTHCEREVMDLLIYGKRDADIAFVLGKAIPTVKNQVATIIRKLHVENRTQAVAKHLAPHLFEKKENP